MRTRIMKAVDELGYQPNAIARSLISNRTNMIGIVMADVINPFYPAVLDLFVRKLLFFLVQHMLTQRPNVSRACNSEPIPQID